ncbi:IPT/TIG domain-containing protein [Streptomyces sp. NPDC093707]|uniref:lipase family protein n=1 Tax=Streptomyces sp. NPDC093707 TaxID=3154984 RepID=UPI00344B2E8E
MTTTAQADPTPAQVTMTLAAMAATAATPRPSGETVQAQARRAMRGITAQLADSTLATRGTWQLKWLAISPDNANLVYIAWNADGSNRFAVVVRGTVGNATDTMEDLDVGTVVPFTVGGSANAAVSAGAMAAFTQVVNARGTTGTSAEPAPDADPGPPDSAVPWGTTLVRALADLLASVPSTPRPTVYVTGHSLGGCIATMVAPYLLTQTWPANTPQFALLTFAAPTAGLKSFADYVDSLNWRLNERHINAYDIVPLAWSELLKAEKWYPTPPGPKATDEVRALLVEIDKLKKHNRYVQPNAKDPSARNKHYLVHDKELVNQTTDDFLGQVAFQHANATYLRLLDAPVLPAGPVVTSLSATAAEGGTQLTVFGVGFTPDSVVDFGPIPCPDFLVDLAGRWIRAVVPEGAGIVDVRVTTMLGTSPAVPLGRFAYGGPPPVVVSAVSPNSGPAGSHVGIEGSGFAQGATVRFKNRDADSVSVESATLIRATVPSRLPGEPQTDEPNANGARANGAKEDKEKTVDVTVQVGVATSPTGPADEFTYTDNT